jgi:YHS domain-containing protein
MKSTLRLFSLFALLAVSAFAKINTNDQGLALEGHDPVAFFTVGQPTTGLATITAQHHGATFQFASEANRTAFVADPVRYAPAYGGFCAFGASKGKLFPVEIDTWQISDGRLMLNHNQEIKAQFDADVADFIATADANWQALAEE